MIHATGSHLVKSLQERAARALSTEHVEYVDGWWLRLAPNCSWWMGTVLPHSDAGPDDLARRVRNAEEFYGRHDLDARFQISPGACPNSLDVFLEDRGYRRSGRMSLQAASSTVVLERASAGSLRVEVNDRPAGDWFEVWHTVHGLGGEWDLLSRVQQPSAYASVIVRADVVAVGRAVADGCWAGVFGMATLPWARRKGAAREALAALANWALTQAADRMYLQVEENDAAVQLYAPAGFEEVCGYHYRVAS